MADKIKIPKRIGGVKIPKKFRKRARKALKMSQSPAGRDFAAAALQAALARAAANGIRVRARSRCAPCPPEPPEMPDMPEMPEMPPRRARPSAEASELGEAIRAAAMNGLKTFLEGLEEGLRKTDGPKDDPSGLAAEPA